MGNTIAAIILTKDEEKHIERCIRSLQGVCEEVFVIDCYSKDNTKAIAESLGAKVYEHPWKNYATQFNWGLHNCPITADWVWRIDADEFLDKGLGQNVKKAISECGDDVNGIYVRKRIDFMGRPLMHGGWYPSYHLKVWRRGHGECENRWMDEHIRIFDGRAVTVEQGDQVDANLNNLTWWMEKHNGYATREMADMLMMEYGLDASAQEVVPKFFGTEEQRKRWLKVKYIKAPLFMRPFINFMIRYVLKAGFLDGKEGFIWHFLQGFSYRFLVDAKIFELKKRFGKNVFATREDKTLEEAVVDLLKEKNMTLSLAESCTGGAVAARIVNVPGASDSLMCGYVTYTNRAKRKCLGVKKSTLNKEGAVSAKCAKEMAKGGAKAARTDVCLSVTGLAGPGGGTKETPVGTVFMGCTCAGKTTTREFHFTGNRSRIRGQAVAQALTFIRDSLLECEE